MIASVLFYSYGGHRALHSFPTRRSSDLLRRLEGRPMLGAADPPLAPRRARLRLVLHPAHKPKTISRSEEHTSELQSQFHLVCRLLLEKKKPLRHRPPPDPSAVGHRVRAA